MTQQTPSVPSEPGLKFILLPITLFILAIVGLLVLMKYGVPWLLCSLMYGGQCG